MGNKVSIVPLFNKYEIEQSVTNIASQIAENTKHLGNNEELIIIGLLNGGFMFMADLIRESSLRNINIKIGFMTVSSYGDNEQSSSVLDIKNDISIDITGKHVLLVDELMDTGNTINTIINYLQTKKPKIIETCCLLNKQKNRLGNIQPTYFGLDCPDEFVIGYGMDYRGAYRHLPFIGKHV